MYWPDYSLHQKRKRIRRGPAFLLALVLGVLLGGFLSNWWRIPNTNGESQANLAGAITEEIMEVPPVSRLIPTTVYLTPTPKPLGDAADFALPDLFDETIMLRRSDFDGRPLIINFWASWCVPCRQEMPALQHAYDTYKADGLMVLGINETYIDDLEAAQAFVTELELTFPSVRDDTGKTSEELYRVMGLPTSVFVTPEGKVAHVQIGQMTEEQIQSYGSQLVVGETISP